MLKALHSFREYLKPAPKEPDWMLAQTRPELVGLSESVLASPQALDPSKCGTQFQQCGGNSWNGATCCDPGLVCQSFGPERSECRPPPCGALHEQCGGSSWSGTTCCKPGLVCQATGPDRSECQKQTLKVSSQKSESLTSKALNYFLNPGEKSQPPPQGNTPSDPSSTKSGGSLMSTIASYLKPQAAVINSVVQSVVDPDQGARVQREKDERLKAERESMDKKLMREIEIEAERKQMDLLYGADGKGGVQGDMAQKLQANAAEMRELRTQRNAQTIAAADTVARISNFVTGGASVGSFLLTGAMQINNMRQSSEDAKRQLHSRIQMVQGAHQTQQMHRLAHLQAEVDQARTDRANRKEEDRAIRTNAMQSIREKQRELREQQSTQERSQIGSRLKALLGSA